MADETEASGWVSIGKAARALGVSKGAIRKRLEAGTLAARDDDGSTKVLLPFSRPRQASAASEATSNADSPTTGGVAADAASDARTIDVHREDQRLASVAAPADDSSLAIQVAALTERAEQLAARLAETQAERDRWLTAAAEARSDARAAVAARDEAERELRLLLARAQFAPALPPGAPNDRDEPRPAPGRRWRRFWKR